MRATTENQGSFLNRISIRRNQMAGPGDGGGNHEHELELLEDIEIFQKHVADRFSSLLEESSSSSSSSSDHSASSDAYGSILSIAFLRKLLDAFICCEAEFKALIIVGREPPSQLSRPPLDRLIPELLDRSVKALDVCNAVTQGVDAVRHCQKLAEIAAAALGASPVSEGQVQRARKALASLAAAISAEDKDCSAAAIAKSTERSWSLGRKGNTASGGTNKDRSSQVVLGSVWWGMGTGWSASKQIQAMSSNLVPPRGAVEFNGLAHPVYIMSCVTVFVMWALVAAIPCRDRAGLAALGHVTAARQSSWATPMIALQERVSEEWKRKEKKGSSGLLDEMQRVERAAVGLSEFAEAFKFPAQEETTGTAAVTEMEEACRRMEEGLGALQQQIREVFHKIVKTRTEVVEVLDQGGKFSTPAM